MGTRMTRLFTLLAAALLSAAVAPQVVLACVADAKPVWRDGTGPTIEEWRAELRQRFFARLAEIEGEAFADAERIYVAQIVQTELVELDAGGKARGVVVHPVLPIRGELPGENVSMREYVWTSCGNLGDGYATNGELGQLFVIYEDDDPQPHRFERLFRQRFFSVPISDAKQPEVLAAISGARLQKLVPFDWADYKQANYYGQTVFF